MRTDRTQPYEWQENSRKTILENQQYASWYWFGDKGSGQTIMAMDLSLCNLFPRLPGQGSVFPN